MEKSTLRNRSIGTKVSDEEYAQLEKLAARRGLTQSPRWRAQVKIVTKTYECYSIGAQIG
jgi:hypothetical protein